MKIGAVVLNWNQPDLTARAVESLRDQVDTVYVVDNGSDPPRRYTPGSADTCRVVVIGLPVNAGYAAGNNRGIEAALRGGCDAVLVMNNDALAMPEAVKALAAYLKEQPTVGVVAPMVVDVGGGRVQHTACLLDLTSGRTRWRGSGVSPERVAKVAMGTDYVSGEGFLARSGVFRSCGLFDERFFCYFEDVEWSVRVRCGGWELMTIPWAVFQHEGGASAHTTHRLFLKTRNRVLFLRWALGKSRARAALLTAPAEAAAIRSLVRRLECEAAARGVIRGWLVGILRRR